MAKLQRWIDLVAELLSRRLPASFEDLARGVPEYQEKLRLAERLDERKRRTALDSIKRTFERDKDELRRLGIPLQSVADDDGVESRYLLRPTDFYLPYLCLAMPGRRATPRRNDRWGYAALATLTFTPDELQAVVEGVAIVRASGDPVLVSTAAAAVRKLAIDLPVDVAQPDGEAHHLPVRTRADATTFARLGDAVQRRKVVRFTYRHLASGEVAERELAPFGLFFVNGHWYVTGHDRQRDARRTFRVSRMADVMAPNDKLPGADFVVPDGFDVRDLARARQAWELGDAEDEVAVVEFLDESGPPMAARALGEPVDGAPAQRRFRVRRRDAFVRWILSFAGSVVPRSPAILVDDVLDTVRATRALYHRAPTNTEPSKPAPPTLPGDTWNAATAAGQLSRILHAIPHLTAGTTTLPRLAAALGTEVETLRRDLHSLGDRYDVPGGFIEGVRLFLSADRVSAETNHFRRPMRLTIPELCALELGLAVLQSRRPPDERAPVIAARERLRDVIMKLPNEPMPGMLPDLAVAPDAPAPALDVLRASIGARRKVQIRYRRSGSTTARDRTVHPYGLVHASGMLYVVAWCEAEHDVRVFRLDRIESIEGLRETFSRDDGIELDGLLSSHRALLEDAPHATMRVRYSPQVARWIAEREGREVEPDGSLVLDHPLADVAWGLRHVLQYGAEAEVLSPASMRDAVRQRLDEWASRGGTEAATTEGTGDVGGLRAH
ncbi:MAG: WYL domain-containing protein [Gemmatimonadaceae bacterium]|nr:WYL domain-containing protein [Gemmatimonadaceae bacterium]